MFFIIMRPAGSRRIRPDLLYKVIFYFLLHLTQEI
jgi:hypothetical protein